MSGYNNIFGFVHHLSHRVNRLCVTIASLLLLFMLIFVIIQVVTRYVFNSPPEWTEEAARYCMIWMGLLGSTVSFYKKQDPILFQPDISMMQKWGLQIRIIEFSAVMLFIAPLIYFGPGFILRHVGRLTESLEIDMGLIVAIIPLYASIVGIHALSRLFSKE